MLLLLSTDTAVRSSASATTSALPRRRLQQLLAAFFFFFSFPSRAIGAHCASAFACLPVSGCSFCLCLCWPPVTSGTRSFVLRWWSPWRGGKGTHARIAQLTFDFELKGPSLDLVCTYCSISITAKHPQNWDYPAGCFCCFYRYHHHHASGQRM